MVRYLWLNKFYQISISYGAHCVFAAFKMAHELLVTKHLQTLAHFYMHSAVELVKTFCRVAIWCCPSQCWSTWSMKLLLYVIPLEYCIMWLWRFWKKMWKRCVMDAGYFQTYKPNCIALDQQLIRFGCTISLECKKYIFHGIMFRTV